MIDNFYLALTAILLLPLLPAYIIYKFLPESETNVEGPYKKLNLKLKGAFAGYFLLVLISLGLQYVVMNSEQKKEGDKSCDNPNKSGQGKQGKPKPGSKLSESQKALGEQLQKMQQRKQGKPGQDGKPQGGDPQLPGEGGEPSQRELNEELAKMALMQEALRRQVEQLRKELGQEGKQGMSNALQEVEKMMEQNEKDLVNGKVTPQSLERQKQIMTRLLEHEKAERKQEQEDRRESNQAPNFVPIVPPELAEEARKKASEREALRRVQPAFKPYYKQSVQKYLQIYSR